MDGGFGMPDPGLGASGSFAGGAMPLDSPPGSGGQFDAMGWASPASAAPKSGGSSRRRGRRGKKKKKKRGKGGGRGSARTPGTAHSGLSSLGSSHGGFGGMGSSGPPTAHSTARDAARMESAQIMSHRFMERNRVKEQLLSQRRTHRAQMQRKKAQQSEQWRHKMERSPFLVDLVAENERIDEENRVRIREDARRAKQLDKRKNRVKNEIILKALAESSDLAALRQEKRMIMLEERRLNALLENERSKTRRKQDLLAAHRAEKQRKQVQHEYRRRKHAAYERELRRQKRELLMEKLDVNDPLGTEGTFGSIYDKIPDMPKIVGGQ